MRRRSERWRSGITQSNSLVCLDINVRRRCCRWLIPGILSTERQKVTRRIQQVKKQLANDEDNDGEKLGKKDRKRLQKKLEELRVDLNYIIVSARMRLSTHS